MNIYITGHKDPDLDSVASAILYAEYLEKAQKYPLAKIIPASAGEINVETAFVLEKFGVEVPANLDKIDILEDDKFILVDHNEELQRHPKVNPENVLELVDHHRVNLNFAFPLQISILPVGSTATIIYSIFQKEAITPSETAQKLTLCAILSDTQGLKSSTTSGLDSEYAHDLGKKLKIDLDSLTFEIFKAKSDISGLSPEEIAKKDFKIFKFGEKEVFIDQVETVEPEKVLSQKEELIKALEKIKSEEGAGIGYIVITDILNVNSRVLYSNEEEERILEKAFTTQGVNGVADIGPRMSRKKDIAPEIERVLNK